MSSNIPLTLACGEYEITRPLIDGTVQPDGIDLTVLTDMDSTTRHWRFYNNQDFDMAEASCSTYLLASVLRFCPVSPYSHGSGPRISSCSSHASRYQASGTMRGLTSFFMAMALASLNA